MKSLAFAISFTFLCILFSYLPAKAATFTVTRSDDRSNTCATGDCSLREAIMAANAAAGDDVILFSGAVSSIVLTEEIEISNMGSLTITGRGVANLEIDGGTGANGIFFINQATVTITDVKLTGGFGGKFFTGGGAIFVHAGSLHVNRVHFVGNNTFGSGGAIYYDGGTGHRIRNSTFSVNTATNCGAFYNDGGTVFVVNSTFHANSVTSVGGAFCTDGTTRVRNITVTGNSAELGGGIQFGFGEFSFGNSIIAGNTATKDYPEMLIDASNVVFAGNNLVGDSPGDAMNTNVPINYPPSDMLDTPPLLGPLQDNGGPTPTRAPLAGSPVINAGNNNRAFDPFDNTPLTTDQRGFARIAGGTVDIGAVESGAGPVAADRSPFDFDGDGKTDVAIFRPGSAEWWLSRSSNGSVFAAQFGGAGDEITPGDYTGDGKADITVWRPSSGEWFVLRSEDFSFFAFPFGTNGDVPAPADFDADGKMDAAVYRPSNSAWFVRRSGDGGTTIETFGTTGDVPVVADYDGDGKADIAIYRPSLGQWWVKRSASSVIAFTFGESTDKPVQGDYTGDAKSDVAFWRPSTGQWFILRSEDFSFYAVPFGTTGDVPSPGDYDGDGKFDTAIFRPSNSTWYVDRSTAGVLIQQFGTTGDVPVPNAYVP